MYNRAINIQCQRSKVYLHMCVNCTSCTPRCPSCISCALCRLSCTSCTLWRLCRRVKPSDVSFSILGLLRSAAFIRDRHTYTDCTSRCLYIHTQEIQKKLYRELTFANDSAFTGDAFLGCDFLDVAVHDAYSDAYFGYLLQSSSSAQG